MQPNMYLSLFTTGDYSDLTVVAGKHYRLHRNLICERSRPLRAACKYKLTSNPEDSNIEASEQILDLTGDDPHAVDCMLQYFYSLDYNFPIPSLTEPDHDVDGAYHATPSILVLHARIYAVAEQYMVDGLKALALEKFAGAAENRWSTHDFLEAAREAYALTPDSDRGLRNIVVKVFQTHQRALLDKEEAVQLLIDVPLLAVHLLKYPFH